ncbi:MAG: glycosyltransferase family 39 protein [Myxococcales bacterium]|nr:glycosyltransferase family 39 protein [Myxococcales bacterium]
MSRLRRFLAALVDPAIGLGLAALYLALLYSTTKNLGYARDEGFYFQAARSYEGWFEQLWRAPKAALEPGTIDRFWSANNEHPALIKSLFALSHKFLHSEWHLIKDEGTSFRFPGMLLSSLAVAVTYAWGRRVSGRLAGLVAALAFAMMPRVYYHAHLDCFDMPVAAMWLFTTYAYFRSVTGGGWRWALFTGVLYGCLLNTKHNSWLLPPALIAHFVIARGEGLWRELRTGTVRAPLALLAMAVIGPVVFYSTWPWIWHDTGRRLAAYVAFHTGHEYYNMEFLGRTYWKPPMPLGYAWLMTAGTVPGITLLLFLIGLLAALRRGARVRLGMFARLLSRLRQSAAPSAATREERQLFSTELLWLLCMLTSYAPWLSKTTPIFGGTKHWLTAYPFLCLFAAQGFVLVRARITELCAERRRSLRLLVDAGLAASVIAAPAAITLTSNPWGLSAYTPLVGGAPGAATLGLNRTFWGYTTGAAQDFLNQRAPPNTVVYVHDTAMQSWDQMVKDGRLRGDLRGGWTPAQSSFALYHHEPHMARVEYQIWVDYGTVAPAYVGTHDGVPVIWVYERLPK